MQCFLGIDDPDSLCFGRYKWGDTCCVAVLYLGHNTDNHFFCFFLFVTFPRNLLCSRVTNVEEGMGWHGNGVPIPIDSMAVEKHCVGHCCQNRNIMYKDAGGSSVENAESVQPGFVSSFSGKLKVLLSVSSCSIFLSFFFSCFCWFCGFVSFFLVLHLR